MTTTKTTKTILKVKNGEPIIADFTFDKRDEILTITLDRAEKLADGTFVIEGIRDVLSVFDSMYGNYYNKRIDFSNDWQKARTYCGYYRFLGMYEQIQKYNEKLAPEYRLLLECLD